MNPSPPETRASLILRLPNAADVAAWEELVTIYEPLIYRMALRQGLQHADAEDLVQEVFTSIARSVGRWLERSDRGRFRAWLLRIAKNTAIDFMTRKPFRPFETGSEADDALAELTAPESPVTREFETEYRRELFFRAADQARDAVAEVTWQAFWLSQIEGLPIAEVARRLQIEVGSVYVARSRVMKRLQELIRQYEV